MGVKIIHKDCDPSLAEDRSLPYNAYLVTYQMDGTVCYDLITTDKKVDIFDYYWDRYREDFITFKQSEGRTNPKLWEPPKKKKK